MDDVTHARNKGQAADSAVCQYPFRPPSSGSGTEANHRGDVYGPQS